MRVVAHRGSSYARRENTLPAFELAGTQGADGVELDVRRTRDGCLRVLHDAVAPELGTLAELLDVEVAEAAPWIPTLDEALEVCEGLVNVEIKDLPGQPGFDEARTTARLVGEALAERAGALLVSSFDPGAVAVVAEVAPGLDRALLVPPGAVHRAIGRAVELGVVAIHPADVDVDASFVRAAHEAGLAVNVWTVDDPARIRRLDDWGVDAVFTNVPDVALDALGR